MIASSDIITSIADDLNRLQEKKRAKKLVFYISQRYWESDYSFVESHSFESLLNNIYQTNPTSEDLKALLYQAVSTLNNKTVYRKIAQYIFKRMSSLYVEVVDQEQIKGNELETQIIDRISKNIQYHEEAPRIKKLIFAACKEYWENDINVIEMYDLKELILELYELYPNQKRLKKALYKIVNSINRQNFYSFIADAIINELTYLYNHEVREIRAEEDSTALIRAKRRKNTSSDSDDSSLIRRKNNQEKNNPEHNEDDSDNIHTQVSASEAGEESLSIKMGTDVRPSSVPEGQVLPWLKVDSLFDLKQEIMQYTNPLKAKIILFYTVYQIDPYEQHWVVVRTCSLDDLLIKLFQQYGQNLQTIEAQLSKISNYHIEALDVEDNNQVVSALTESIKHFYKK